MLKKNLLVVCLMLLMGFLGGLAGQFIFMPHVVWAQSQSLSAERYYFTDSHGKTIGQIYSVPGTGALLVLNSAQGQQRLQLGTYNAPNEAGLPLVGLSDNNSDLRMLLRLAGSNESPVIVFKDKQHRDRMVLGLGLEDSGQEPFLAIYDAAGAKKMIFGEY